MKQLESLVVMLLCTFGAITQANATTIQTDSIESKRSQIDVASDQEHRTKKLIKSPFGLGLDIQTKYIWRGMEMMTEDAAPVLFPSVNFGWKGLYAYFMGGYAINGKYAEVDAGVSYTWKGLTIGIYDYYYPTVDNKEDHYIKGDPHTGHWLEGCITYSPEQIPVWVSLSNFFYGADKYLNSENEEKQAYSTYLEIGGYYTFAEANKVSITAGAALNKSCYNGYEHNFSVVNLEFRYTRNIEFKSGWSLPLSVAYIYNPVFDKSFINFTANFAF